MCAITLIQHWMLEYDGVWLWTRYHLHYHSRHYLRYTYTQWWRCCLGHFKNTCDDDDDDDEHLDGSSEVICDCCPANWDLSAVDHVVILFTIGQQYRTLASMGGRVSRFVGNWTCTEWTCPSCLDMHESVRVLPGQHVRSCLVKRGDSARRYVSFGVAPAGQHVWSLIWRQQACLNVSVGRARGQRLIPLVNAADEWRAAASRIWWYQHRHVTIYLGGQSRSWRIERIWQIVRVCDGQSDSSE